MTDLDCCQNNLNTYFESNKVSVCGLRVFPFTSKKILLDYVSDRNVILIALGAEKLLSKDARFIKIVNDNIGYCDGIGAVIALKKKGFNVPKIPGAYLWLDVIRRFNDRTFYIIGGKEVVLQNTVNKLNKDFPGICICGARNGYFNEGEYEALKQDIVEKKPEVVFVAMGSPKQEYIMDDLIKSHPALYMGLGGSFDLYTGLVKPVPEWWKKYFHWEGLYRQFYDLTNIKRWKRQFVVLGLIWRIVFDKL